MFFQYAERLSGDERKYLVDVFTGDRSTVKPAGLPTGWNRDDGTVSIDSLGDRGRAFLAVREAKRKARAAVEAEQSAIILP